MERFTNLDIRAQDKTLSIFSVICPISSRRQQDLKPVNL